MKLEIVQWNINGYHSKLPHLQQYIDEQSPKIVCLQETWLKKENIIRLKGYQQPPVRKERENKRGGGVCIFVAEGLPWDEIKLFDDLEAVAVQLHLPGKKLLFAHYTFLLILTIRI